MAFFSPSTASGDVIDVNVDVNLDNFTLQDLLKLRADIDRRLPAKHLRDVNLERELILQHQATLELQNQVMQDSDVPANQRAQCANAVASILQQLIKLQETVHTTERLKRIEGTHHTHNPIAWRRRWRRWRRVWAWRLRDTSTSQPIQPAGLPWDSGHRLQPGD